MCHGDRPACLMELQNSSSCPAAFSHTQRRPPRGTQRLGLHSSSQELPSVQEMTLELPIPSFKNVLKTSFMHQHQAVCCPSWTRGCSRRRAVCRPPWTRTCSRRQPVCAHDGHGTAPSTKQYAFTMDMGLLHEKQAIKGDRHIRTRNDLHFWQESQCPRSPRIDFLLRDKAQAVGLKLPGNRSKRPQ